MTRLPTLLLALSCLTACNSDKEDDSGDVGGKDDTGSTTDDTGSITDDSGSTTDDTGSTTDDTGPADVDGDGYDATVDCDDNDATIHPGATESCNGVDDDCDDLVDDDDDDVSDATTWYTDGDGDGYGVDDGSSVTACETPGDGWAAAAEDCDDADAAINPGAAEICDDDDVDEDCNGLSDDDDSGLDPDSAIEWFYDEDEDGFGDPDDSTFACEQPDGYLEDDTDCDPDDEFENPDIGCAETARNGTYTGDITVDIEISSLSISDACTGDVTIDVDVSATDEVDGSGDCEFTGDLATLVGAATFTISGEVAYNNNITGEIDIPKLASVDWIGSVRRDGTLYGTSSGTATISGIDADYEIVIDTER